MINKSELRIGNYTSDIHTPTGMWKIKSIGECIVKYGNYAANTYKSRYEHLLPIPLSPEILEKAGFEKYQWQDAWFIKTEYGHLYIHFFRDRIITKFVLVTKDSVGHKMKSIGFIGNMKGTEEIKQLHQLQNFIYVITGQELTINLK